MTDAPHLQADGVVGYDELPHLSLFCPMDKYYGGGVCNEGDETAGSSSPRLARRYTSKSVTTIRMISATGMASNAPGMPSSTAPTSTAAKIVNASRCSGCIHVSGYEFPRTLLIGSPVSENTPSETVRKASRAGQAPHHQTAHR